MHVITRSPYPATGPDAGKVFFTQQSKYQAMLQAMRLDESTKRQLAQSLDAEIGWLQAVETDDPQADALFERKNQLVKTLAEQNPAIGRISAALIGLIRKSRYDLTPDTAAQLSPEERLSAAQARVEKNALMEPLYQIAGPYMQQPKLLFTLERDDRGLAKLEGKAVGTPRHLVAREPWRSGPLGKLHQKTQRERFSVSV